MQPYAGGSKSGYKYIASHKIFTVLMRFALL